MAAVGLLDQNDAVRYFDRFPQLLDQSVERRVLIRPLTLERLLALMVDAEEEDFVIVSHGNPDGLVLPLTETTRVTAGEDVIKILLNALATIQEVPRAGSDLRRWRRILDRLDISGLDSARDLDDALRRQLETAVEQWLDGADISGLEDLDAAFFTCEVSLEEHLVTYLSEHPEEFD